MLEHVHNRQPTVILRRKSECLDVCTATRDIRNLVRIYCFRVNLIFTSEIISARMVTMTVQVMSKQC